MADILASSTTLFLSRVTEDLVEEGDVEGMASSTTLSLSGVTGDLEEEEDVVGVVLMIRVVVSVDTVVTWVVWLTVVPSRESYTGRCGACEIVPNLRL